MLAPGIKDNMKMTGARLMGGNNQKSKLAEMCIQ